MYKFNEALYKDILYLKNLRAKRDKTEYLKMREVIMETHGIELTTVYRHLKLVKPGLCSTTWHSTKKKPVTEEEILMVRELLMKQISIMEIRRTMERHTGDTCSFSRIAKIRREIDKRTWPEDKGEISETVFGGSIRSLFIEYCNLDIIDPSTTQKLELKGREYLANSGVVKDSIDMIIYSAENEGKSTPVINRMKMENMLAKKMDLVTKGHYISTFELRALESIRRSLDSRKNVQFHPDYKVLAEVCREIRPDLSDIDIFLLADKHQRLIKDSTEDIVPFRKEVMEIASKEAEENM